MTTLLRYFDVSDSGGEMIVDLTYGQDPTVHGFDEENQGGIFLVDLTDDSRPVQLTDENNLTNEASRGVPSGGGDGGQIVFTRTISNNATGEGSKSLWIIDEVGAAPRRLPRTEAAAVGCYAFSPNGSQLAFTRRRDGRIVIYTLRGGSSRLLPKTAGFACVGDWARVPR